MSLIQGTSKEGGVLARLKAAVNVVKAARVHMSCAACGVVLYVEEGDMHRRFIMRRERHNNRGLAHYLGNLDRIREIQSEMVSNGHEAGWLVIDASAQDDPVGMVKASFE